MEFGLDYVSGPPIADMLAAKVSFVCRYVGYFSGYDINQPHLPQGKVLTPGEAKALLAVGISPISNWEWYETRPLEGVDAGKWDAETAHKIHLACGGPPDRPIYFSVDTGVAGEQVANYFHGVASVLSLSRTAAYGSYRVLKYLFDNHLITWGWQTYAWSYGAWEPRACIQQYHNSMTMAGHSVDYNRSTRADFGQWGIASAVKGTDMVAIDIHTPGVAAEFKEIDAQHWQSLRTGKVIAHGLLEAYKKYGNSGKCGLDYLGHPNSNEQVRGTNKVIQFFDKGVLCWDNGNVFPLPLYTGGDGEDPRVKALTAQLQAEQQKTMPPDPVAQQKIDRYDAILKIVAA